METKFKWYLLILLLSSKIIYAIGYPLGESYLLYEKAWNNKNLEGRFTENAKCFTGVDQQIFLSVNYHEFQCIKEEFFNGINTTNVEELNKWLDKKQLFLDSVWNNFDPLNYVASASPNLTAIPTITTTCAGCDNIGFENTSDPVCGWDLFTGNASSEYLTTACNDLSCFGLTSGSIGSHFDIVHSGGNAPYTASLLPELCPWGGASSIRLENYLNGGNASVLKRVFTIPSGTRFFKYSYAIVLEDPGIDHADVQKPFFRARIKMIKPSTHDTIEMSCAKFTAIANPETDLSKEGFIKTPDLDHVYFKPWTKVVVPLKESVESGYTDLLVEFIVSDCSLGGHFGFAYIDASCMDIDLAFSSCDATSQTVSISPYSSDAEVKKDFKSFWWTGPGIVGPNYTPSIKVNQPGDYNVLLTTLRGCQTTISASNTTTCPQETCTITGVTATPSSCNSATNLFSLSVTISASYSAAPANGVMVISDGNISKIYYYPFPTTAINFINLMADGRLHNINVTIYYDNFFAQQNVMCSYTTSYTAPAACETLTAFECTDCLPSFSPEPGVYIVSAWVKLAAAAADAETFADPYIEISFSSGSTTLPKLRAKGKIIDGWQRIFEEITIPSGQSNIQIRLGTDAGETLFDDIRVHPAKSGFVSYVYDPVTLKLLATLDDNNYATLYEYDKEGTLTRVKKETERGIVTIKETRQNSPKH